MGNVNADEKREMITRKAFELYQKRGCEPGHEMDDWLEAEKAVDRELKGSVKSPSHAVTLHPGTDLDFGLDAYADPDEAAAVDPHSDP